MKMSRLERELSRHALGLPNKKRTSYRNRFYGLPDDPAWVAMIGKGWATSTPQPGELVCFQLTREGAELALNPSENLCKEDFPS